MVVEGIGPESTPAHSHGEYLASESERVRLLKYRSNIICVYTHMDRYAYRDMNLFKFRVRVRVGG